MSTSLPKPCLTAGCPNLSYTGPRCRDCEASYQYARNRKPERQLYADPAYRALPKTGTCWICGEPGADSRDHVVPVSKGGTNDASNVRPAHRACNSRRGNGGDA